MEQFNALNGAFCRVPREPIPNNHRYFPIFLNLPKANISPRVRTSGVDQKAAGEKEKTYEIELFVKRRDLFVLGRGSRIDLQS